MASRRIKIGRRGPGRPRKIKYQRGGPGRPRGTRRPTTVAAQIDQEIVNNAAIDAEADDDASIASRRRTNTRAAARSALESLLDLNEEVHFHDNSPVKGMPKIPLDNDKLFIPEALVEPTRPKDIALPDMFHDVGSLIEMCIHCHAKFFDKESAKLCCSGKIGGKLNFGPLKRSPKVIINNYKSNIPRRLK